MRKITEATNNLRIINARQDEQIAAIKEQHGGTIAALEAIREDLLESVQAWAEAHPEEFAKAKSISLTHGVIGWRTGTPALKTLSGWTFDRVLEKLKTLGGKWLGYVRQVETVDKQLIIADRNMIGEATLKSVGLRVVQAETFFCEPQLTETVTTVKG